MVDITVMDFAAGTVTHYSPEDVSLEDDAVMVFIEEQGHRLSDCEYMFAEELEVTHK